MGCSSIPGTLGPRGRTHPCVRGVSGHMPILAEDASRTRTRDPSTDLETPRLSTCPTKGKPLASSTPPKLFEGQHPGTVPFPGDDEEPPAESLHPGRVLTSTRVPLVTRSPVTVSSDAFISACSR